MKEDIITVGGPPGSGTSTLCRLLEERTGMRYVYIGALFRQLAERHGMELLEFSAYALEHPEIDRELDELAIEEAVKGDIILEGRLAGWMTYRHGVRAFRIWIDADEEERARRIMEREGGTLEEVAEKMRRREAEENTRYMKIYGIDLDDMSVYDLVVDSTRLPPKKVLAITEESYARWKAITEGGN